MGDRAFIASAPTLWNDLPLEIRMAKSVHIFLWPSCYFLSSETMVCPGADE